MRVGDGDGGVVLPVLGSPALDSTHTNGAHSGPLVDRLEPLIHRLGKQGRKLLVVEDFEIASCQKIIQ